MISVLFHTLFFTFGKDTYSQSFKYKEYIVNGAKLSIFVFSYGKYSPVREKNLSRVWKTCCKIRKLNKNNSFICYIFKDVFL